MSTSLSDSHAIVTDTLCNSTGTITETKHSIIQSNKEVSEFVNNVNITQIQPENTHQTTLFKPPVKIDANLIRYQKLAQIKIARSLASSPKRQHYTASIKLLDCGRYLGKTSTGNVALNRCHRRSCPICATIKGRQYTRLITKACDQMSYTLLDEVAVENRASAKTMIGLKITLNCGEACPLADIKDRLRVMHSTWSRMLKTKLVDRQTIGAFRATEITQSDNATANPHIHGLIFVKSDTDLISLDRHMRFYWRRVTKREIKKISKVVIDNRASFQQLEPLYSHTTSDVMDWVKYATKGSYDYSKAKHRNDQQSTTSAYWLSVDDATKGMRLISCSGELKTAIISVKQNTPKRAVEDTVAQFAWSDTRSEYVTLAEYSEHDDVGAPLSQSLSYLHHHSHFADLFKRELDEFDHRKMKRQLIKLRSDLLNNGDHDLIRKHSELFISNTRIVKPTDNAENYHEPVEVDRAVHRMDHIDRYAETDIDETT